MPVAAPEAAPTTIPTNSPPPIADFTASPREGQVPLTVTFTALTTGEVTRWQWDFGDGQFSNQPAPSHTYTSSDEYTVSMTVMGPGGSDAKTKSAYINTGRTAINWKEATNYIGHNKLVEGVIVDTHYASSTKGKPTFLNFNKPYKGYFTCILWGSDRAKFMKQFPPNPETYFLNKRVLVNGLIEEYPKGSGVPEIVLKEPSQIEVIEK
jgi:PKD repeat protein